MGDCKSRIRLPAGGPFLAKSIVAIATLWCAELAGIASADLIVMEGAGQNRGFQIVTIRGPGGETCQARFGNVLFVFTQVAREERLDFEDISEAPVPHAGPQIQLVRGTADEFVFGTGQSTATVSNRLDVILRRQVGAINDRCDLTQVQLQKILLAGRGDIQRLLDRAATLKGQIEKPVEISNVEQFTVWCTRLSQESTIMGARINSGPFDMNSLFAKTVRTTLTSEQLKQLNDQKGILVASTTPPSSGARPAAAAVGLNAAVRLETVLKEWDLAAARIQRLDCTFARMKYDPVFEVEFRGEGSLAVDRKGRALYKVAAAGIIPGVQSKKVGPGGTPYQLKADSSDRWHWTGDRVIRVDDWARTYEEARIPTAGRHVEHQPEPPALPDEVGSGGRKRQPAADSDSIAGFDVFYEPLFGLTKTFLLGMPSDELKRRFKVTFLSEDDAEVRLQFEPIWPRDALHLSSAQLILSKAFYRPRALRMVGPGGAETVHVFRDVAVDTPDDRAPLDRPDLAGFRKIVNDRPAR